MRPMMMSLLMMMACGGAASVDSLPPLEDGWWRPDDEPEGEKVDSGEGSDDDELFGVDGLLWGAFALDTEAQTLDGELALHVRDIRNASCTWRAALQGPLVSGCEGCAHSASLSLIEVEPLALEACAGLELEELELGLDPTRLHESAPMIVGFDGERALKLGSDGAWRELGTQGAGEDGQDYAFSRAL